MITRPLTTILIDPGQLEDADQYQKGSKKLAVPQLQEVGATNNPYRKTGAIAEMTTVIGPKATGRLVYQGTDGSKMCHTTGREDPIVK
jgi:hypothetical protein